MSITLSVSSGGSITASYASGSNSDPGISGSLSLSYGGVALTATVPVVMPVSSNAGLFNWNDIAGWSNSYVLVQGTADIIDIIGGALAHDIPRTVSSLENALNSAGPTLETVSLPIGGRDFFGVPVSFNVAIRLNFDVTIASGSDIVLNQQNVEIDSLTVQAGGVLEADNSSQNLPLIDNGIANFGLIEATGAGNLSLLNISNSGTVNAAGGTIFVAAANSTDNVGLFEATNGGVLYVNGNIYNSGMFATSGSNSHIYLDGVTVTGVLQASAGTTIEIESGATFDGSTSTFVNKATVSALHAPLHLLGTIDNRSEIDVGPGLHMDSNVTLEGGGQIVLVNGVIDDGNLTNVDNTIAGSGQISSVQFTNQASGILDASVAGQELLLNSLTNNAGLLEATNGGVLYVQGRNTYNTGILEATNGGVLYVATTDNTSGVIEAQSGGTVAITGTVSGGTVEAVGGSTVNLGEASGPQGGILRSVTLTGGGTFESTGGSYDDGSELQDVTLAAGVTLSAFIPTSNAAYGGLMALGGTITNNGTINVGSSVFLGIDGPVTLTGGGTLNGMGGGASIVGGQTLQYKDFLLHLNSAADALDNVNNTINGGDFAVDLTNESGGILEASSGQELSTRANTVNKGLIEGLNGGALTLSATVRNSSTINALMGSTVNIAAITDNTGGVIEAQSGGTVSITGTVSGGTVEALSGSTVSINAGGSFSGGTIIADNNSTIEVGQSGGVTNVVLSGGGTLVVFGAGIASGTTINTGTLELGNGGTLGGLVTLGGANDVLKIDSTTMPTNTNRQNS